MSQGSSAAATICMVNYRTLDLTRLCLRSIRKHTTGSYRVLVIDNNSQDASLDYLRSLSWITLIERCPETPDPNGSAAHGAALDLGLQYCRTPIFVSLHSDTMILQSGWLNLLCRPFSNARVASVGTGKLELKPQWQQWLKRATDLKAWIRRIGASDENKLHYCYFNTTICSAYRTQVLQEEGLNFQGQRQPRLTVGRELYYALQDRGYQTVALPVRKVSPYVVHLAHATQVLLAEEFGIRGRGESKYLKRARQVLERPNIQALREDESLDQ